MGRRTRGGPPSPVHSIPTSAPAPAAQADPPPLPAPIPTPAATTRAFCRLPATNALRAGAAGYALSRPHVWPRIASALAGNEKAPAGLPRISKQASRIEARRSSGCAIRYPPVGPTPKANGPQ